MGKTFEWDADRLERMFERLSPQNIQAMEGQAINDALNKLYEETINNLRSTVPGATRSGVTPMGTPTKPMTKGVIKRIDPAYATGLVHIMGDYRLKWFEMGTDERFTTGARSKNRKGDIKKIIPAGQSRGRIRPYNFFRSARDNADVIETYTQSLLSDIEDAFNG